MGIFCFETIKFIVALSIVQNFGEYDIENFLVVDVLNYFYDFLWFCGMFDNVLVGFGKQEKGRV